MKNFQKLLSLSSIYALGNLGEKALSFIFIPIYTTFLSTKDYGIVALMSITVSLISKFVSSPVSSAFIRHYYAPEYKDKKGELVFNLFLWMLLKTLFLVFIFWKIVPYIAGTLLGNNDLVYIVKIYSFILFFEPLSSFFQCLLHMLERAKYLVFVSISKLILTASLILYLLIGLKMGVVALILGNLLGAIFTVIMIFPFFMKISSFKLRPLLLIKPFKYSYPLLFSGYSNFLIQSGDRYVLRMFNSINTVGLYSFGYGFAGIVNILLSLPIKYALQPIVFKLENKPEELRDLLNKYATYFYLGGIFVCLFVSLFSREAIFFLSRKEEFWRSWLIVPIIAFSYIHHGLLNFFSKGVTMRKKSWHASASVIITAIVNIGLNFIFIPLWGIIGAAFATLISYFVWNALYIYYSAKFYKLYFDIKRLAYIAIIGAGLYLSSLIITDNRISLLNTAIKFLFFSLYPAFFFITDFFTPTEKALLGKFIEKIRKNVLRRTYAEAIESDVV